MRRALLAAAAVCALALPASALEVPYLSGRVNDEAGMLDAASARALDATLKDYETKTGRQLVVLTVPTLDGEALEDFTLKVARTWKLGRKGQDDGILIFVARDDHKMRIEVGYGLEGDLPDALCGRIIRGEMTPRFRHGDFAGGITAGAKAVIGALDGSYSPPPDPVRMDGGRNDFALMDAGQKVMMSFFVFGILGLFEFFGLVAPGVGWFLYFFLIPFWAAFPMAIWGVKVGGTLLGAHLLGFPILKMILPKTDWGKKMAANVHTSGGGMTWSSGGGGGGFSGGGGSFGGGGASGSW